MVRPLQYDKTDDADPTTNDPYANAVQHIESAALPAPVYRTARRLLDLAASNNGDIVLDRADALTLTGGADGTMRSHLVQLARAGIIRYHTNHFVSVRLVAWGCGEAVDNPEPAPPPRAERAGPRAQRSDTRAQRANSPTPPRAERASTRDLHPPQSPRALSDHPRALSARNRALSDQIPPPMVGCLVVNPIPDQGDNQTTNQMPPTTTAPESVIALLVDVGVGAAEAKKLAHANSRDEILRQVSAWLPEASAGRQGVGLLVKRLRDRWGAPLPSDAFYRSDLYRRHFGDAPTASPNGNSIDLDDLDEAERRRRYIPDDLSDIIVG